MINGWYICYCLSNALWWTHERKRFFKFFFRNTFLYYSDVENYCALYRIGIANYKKLGVKQILKNRYPKLNFCHVHISIEIFKYIKDLRFQNFINPITNFKQIFWWWLLWPLDVIAFYAVFFDQKNDLHLILQVCSY